MTEKVYILHSCPNCGIPADGNDDHCYHCGYGEISIIEMTENELELALLEHELWEERNIRQMEDCDGSWDW